MIRYLFAIVLMLTIFCRGAGAAEAFWGKVKKVIDGDSLIIVAKEKTLEVRLYGVDTPEFRQPFAEDAKRFTKKWVGTRPVLVQPEHRDSYGRTVVIITQGDKVLNKDLVAAGLGWVYPRYCRQEFCKDWETLQTAARMEKSGLWAGRHPIAPWQWKRHRKSDS